MNKKVEEETECDDDVAHSKFKALDGGWGWMVVLGSALCHVIFGIIVRAFGVTYLELLDRFHASATVTSWIGAINITVPGICAPAVTALCMRFSCRSVTIVGGVLTALGIIGTAYATNIGTVFFTFGILSGIGISLSYTPGYIMVGEYFDKRKALAMSMSTFASGIGAMFPPVMLYLFEHYKYDGGLLIIGGITLHCCIAGAMYRPLKNNYKGNKDYIMKTIASHSKNSLMNKENEICEPTGHEDNPKVESLSMLNGCELQSMSKPAAADKKVATSVTFNLPEYNESDETIQAKPVNRRRESIFNSPDPKIKFFNASLLKDPRFLSLLYGIFCSATNVGFTSAYVPILAIEKGIPVAEAVFLLSLGGIASMAAALSFGSILDMKRIKPHRIFIYIFCLFLIGISTLVNPLAEDYVSFAILVFIRGAFGGVFMTQRATITSDIVGQKRLNHAVGLVLFATSIGFLCGRGSGGLLKDATGQYDAVFYMGGIITIIGAGVLLYTEIRHLYRNNRSNK